MADNIKIKPGNKGKFTKKAKAKGMTAHEYAIKVMAHPDQYDSATVKQANFAKNASGWGK